MEPVPAPPVDDLAEAASALAEGRTTPETLLEACLARLEAHNPELNAIIAMDLPAARAAAAESGARRRAGKAIGPLDGVPFTVKDNLYAAGFGATWGSRLFRDFVPGVDDLCVARLRAAGAVLVGKTNTPEFALAVHTSNPVFGTTRNPWNPAMVPAGSSGGAAAAVAAGMAPLAIGTDAGGSIRLPAAFTGLSGFKPSTGRIPRLHGFPALSLDYQAIGVMARDVAGLRLAMHVLAGGDARDRASLAFGPLDASAPAGGTRIRLVMQAGGEGTDPAVAALLCSAAAVLAEAGCTIAEGDMPGDATALRDFSAVLSAVGVARVVQAHEGWQDLVTPAIRAVAERGLALSGIDYARAHDGLAAWRASVGAAMGDDDILVTPTCPTPPWPIESGPPATVGGQPAGPRMPVAFTAFANAMGWPAISIPCGLSPDGLPIGLHLIGRYGEDARVLALAEAFQQRTAWHKARPPLGETP
ncbi:amidase [Roseomonas stagni]|uniref:Amidase n=1 Tax=Falsiroseomonas algicola TaxID=2716930 RepID=A0A6M1LJ70_9PROT|nr:amidase [Falsiroseomonas algicola]NGM20049.1 amidase [Falsiroseomonas algicola]